MIAESISSWGRWSVRGLAGPSQAVRRWHFLLPFALFLVCGLAAATATTNATPEGAPARPRERTGGITYFHDEITDVPWSVHIVKVDRSHPELRFETTLGAGRQIGMSLVSDQVKALSVSQGRPLAAVNGDFYKTSGSYPGDPEGVQIFHGELVSAPRPTHSCFWVDAGGAPRITNVQSRFQVTLPGGTSLAFGLNEERGKDAVVLFTAANGASTRARGGVELVLMRGPDGPWLPIQAGTVYQARVKQVNEEGNSPLAVETMVLSAGPEVSAKFAGLKPGDAIKISTGTLPDLAGSQVAIGGGPALVRGGVALTFSGLQPRHPRTALGWNREHYFLVEVDGRQRASAGMSFPELATYLAKLGCTDAINLDGGGSATLWAFGNVMNNPSEGRERPAANGLVLVRKPAQD